MKNHGKACGQAKVYCHLGSYEDSLTYALGAGELFNTEDSKNQYVGTIIAKAIDSYTARRAAGKAAIDPRLEAIVDTMLARCFQHGQYRHALGIAIETRRLDVFEKAVGGEQTDAEVCDMLSYAFRVVMSLIQSATTGASCCRPWCACTGASPPPTTSRCARRSPLPRMPWSWPPATSDSSSLMVIHPSRWGGLLLLQQPPLTLEASSPPLSGLPPWSVYRK